MFYQELLTIENYSLYSELIEELDTWFAFLPPSQRNNITASRVSIKFDIDYTLAESILESCCKLDILEKQYDVQCPSCSLKLKVVSEDQLYNVLTSSIDWCHGCDSEDINITLNDIFTSYRLLKKPSSSPDKIRTLASAKLQLSESKINNVSLIDQIKDGSFNVNNIFFSPSSTEKEHLITLFSDIEKVHEKTTEKGDSLEKLVLYLFKIVKPFKASKIIRTKTNQIDCFVRNTLHICSTVFNDLGSHYIVECKNEKQKPNITYYQKLLSLLNDSTSSNIGIIVSILPATRTCPTASRESWLKNKTLVINIDKNDLYDIIFNDYNLLDIIQAKICEVKINPTSPLKDSSLYNNKIS